jgi:integrase
VRTVNTDGHIPNGWFRTNIWKKALNKAGLGFHVTPHGLRHTHKTLMEELRTPLKLMDERMGHEDGSVQARYSHITPDMRSRLMKGLTEQWEAALDARRTLHGRSPVGVLDDLLTSTRFTTSEPG